MRMQITSMNLPAAARAGAAAHQAGLRPPASLNLACALVMLCAPGILASAAIAATAATAAVEPRTWPRPAPVRELVGNAAKFRPFSEEASVAVERAFGMAPLPAGDALAHWLSLRVHLGLYLGQDGRALAAAAQIRETITPAAERVFSGLLTEAMVVARAAVLAGPASPGHLPALRAALESRLATLPATAEITAVVARQRERFRELSRASLIAEADRLGARLDQADRWTLADVDDVVRIGHRLATLLPLRDTLLGEFEAALARRSGPKPQASTAGSPHSL